MEELITDKKSYRHFLLKISLIVVIASLLSFANIIFCTKFENLQNFYQDHFWFVYVFSSIYLVLVLLALLPQFQRSKGLVSIVLVSILICNVFIDASSSASNLHQMFYVFSSMNIAIVGLLIYQIFESEDFDYKYALICIIIGSLLLFIVLIVLDFDNILQYLLNFFIGVAFGGYITLILYDIDKRYLLKSNEYIRGAIMLYLDLLIIPYLITKFRRSHYFFC